MTDKTNHQSQPSIKRLNPFLTQADNRAIAADMVEITILERTRKLSQTLLESIKSDNLAVFDKNTRIIDGIRRRAESCPG